MRYRHAWGTLIAGAAGAAVPWTNTSTSTGSPTTNGDPCAIISSKAASYLSANPEATSAILKPSEVHACLQSVPHDPRKDIEQISWLKQIFQLQSTLAYLKDPPPNYPLPAVDIMGGLDDISSSIANGKYTNEYDIELDMYNLVNSANDGHLGYLPLLLRSFVYRRGVSLVSVSLDGIMIPKIYVLCLGLKADIINLSSASYIPSAVTSFNGRDINEVIELTNGEQDLDALYNTVFYYPAAAEFNEDKGIFESTLFSKHDDTTTLSFANGTNIVVDATAEISRRRAKDIPESVEEFTNILFSTDSNSPNSSWISPATSTSQSSLSSPSPSSSSTSSGSSHPSPVVAHSLDLVSGFFLTGTDNSDVAVLDLASFEEEDELATEFLDTSSTFLAKCKSAGKQRLIIDVRHNGGGKIKLGYRLFRQLFPDIVPYSSFRIRDSPAVNMMGKIASSDFALKDMDIEELNSVFTAQSILQRTNGPAYSSWQEFYGPLQQHGDLFSNLGSWTYSTVDDGSIVAAITNDTELPPQVFASENIIVLTDGYCASTCTDFVNLLINQGNVKTVAIGGRPNNEPMAVIGGVQGAQTLNLGAISLYAEKSIEYQANLTGDLAKETAQAPEILGPLASPPPVRIFPGKEAVQINLLDNIAENDTSFTPMQFSGGVAANCRTYYVPGDIVDVTHIWSRVARGFQAGGQGLCIGGTIGTIGSMGSAIMDNFH